MATVLVQNGTLKLGDSLVAGTVYGKVRAMVNDRGDNVKKAGPSVPVEVLGLSDVPAAGDLLACRLLGFRPERIRLVEGAFEPMRWPIAAGRPELPSWPEGSFPAARAPAGWVGEIEMGGK